MENEIKLDLAGLYREGARAIVFFDGVCGLCDHLVHFCRDQDPKKKLRFAPIQGATYKRLLGEIRLDSMAVATLGKSGIKRIYRNSDAALEVAGLLTFPWKTLRLFRICPRFLRDLGYAFLASIRYRIFGKYVACRLPQAGERELFLS